MLDGFLRFRKPFNPPIIPAVPSSYKSEKSSPCPIAHLFIREQVASCANCGAARDKLLRVLQNYEFERVGGNRRQAAGILGISLRTLHRKITEYGIDRVRKR